MATSSKQADYGFDAPYVPVMFSFGTLAMCAAASNAVSQGNLGGAVVRSLFALWFALHALSFVYATRRGKFEVWEGILNGLALHGNERVLDVGCGRGAVLIAVAKRLKESKIVGIDLWRSIDQTGNAAEVTKSNCDLEGVTARVEIVTGDMCKLPFTDHSMDVVVSSLAIHNVREADERSKAIDEMWRVLSPGGKLRIVDIRHTRNYAERLKTLGAVNVTEEAAGWRMWFGGPFGASRVVCAHKTATV
jgi:arsenite methyltransferase